MKSWFQYGASLRVGARIVLISSLSPNLTFAQTSNETLGARFVSVDEKSSSFQLAGRFFCDLVYQTAEYTAFSTKCLDEMDWALAHFPAEHEPRLFRFAKDSLASASVTMMDQSAMDQLTPDDVRRLIEFRISQNELRGQLQIEKALAEEIDLNGNLIAKTAIVSNMDDEKLLFEVSITELSTGLGFFETSYAIADISDPYALSEIRTDFHDNFIGLKNGTFDLREFTDE